MGKKNAETSDANEVPFETDDLEIKSLQELAMSGDDDAEFANHEEISTSLAPYWNPAPKDMVEKKYVNDYVRQGKGLSFYATPIDFDDSNPEFKRWGLVAEKDLVCYTGSDAKGTMKAVVVRKGEPFTVNVYGSLPLEKFIGIPVRVKVIDQQPSPPPKKPRWVFRVTADPEAKALYDAERKALAASAIQRVRQLRASNGAAFKKAPQLPASGQPTS